MNRRTAILVNTILKGAKPVDSPVEQATTFNLPIAKPTAETPGIESPKTLLAAADVVTD